MEFWGARGATAARFCTAMGLFGKREMAETLEIPVDHKEIKSRPDTGKLRQPQDKSIDAPPSKQLSERSTSKRRVTFQEPHNEGISGSQDSLKSEHANGANGSGSSSGSSSSSSSSSSGGGGGGSSSSSNAVDGTTSTTTSSNTATPLKASQQKLPSTAARPPPPEPSMPEPALNAPPSGEVSLNLKRSKSRSPLDSLRVKLLGVYFALRRSFFGAPRTGKGSFAEPAQDEAVRQHL